MSTATSFLVIAACAIGIAQSSALEIELRYDLDVDGFFDQPGAREAMRAVADFYEELIVDELEAIDPSTFPTPSNFPARAWHPTYLEPAQNMSTVRIPGARNMIVPANTIIVYPGGRRLVSAGLGGPGGFTDASGEAPPFNWSNQLFSRNEPGGLRINSSQRFNTPTDYAPWGGVVFFDENLLWNFSLTDSEANSGLDFVSIALHEMGHVLGFGQVGTPTFRWPHLVQNRTYIGELGNESNAEPDSNLAPGLTSAQNHWSDNTPLSHTLEGFGQRHGALQRPIMVAISRAETTGQFAVLTDLDLAALQDIGWEIRSARPDFAASIAVVDAQPTLTFPTNTGVNYLIEKGNMRDGFEPLTAAIAGDGSLLTVPVSSKSEAVAFYRVRAIREDLQAPQSNLSQSTFEQEGEMMTPPDLAPWACQCGAH